MVKLLDWSLDHKDIWLMRVVFVLFTTIIGSIIAYNYLIPYGPHNEIVKVCLGLGAIPGITFLVGIDRLTRRNKPEYV